MTVSNVVVGFSSVNNATVSGTIPLSQIIAGDSVVVAVMSGDDGELVSSVSDGSANVYSLAAQILESSSNACAVSLFYCLRSVDLSAGGTLTANLAGSTASKAITAWSVRPGAGALLTTGTADGNSATPSVTTIDSVGAGSIVFGCLSTQFEAIPTPPGGLWVSDNLFSVNRIYIADGNQITISSGTVTYNPTLSPGKKWVTAIAAFAAINRGLIPAF